MNCDSSWKFSAPIKLVDVTRILKEAGPFAKCVRLTIDGKVYTAVNSKRVGVLPDPKTPTNTPGIAHYNSMDGFPARTLTVVRSANGKPAVVSSGSVYTDWVIYVGDYTGEVIDRVKVSVEVYK